MFDIWAAVLLIQIIKAITSNTLNDIWKARGNWQVFKKWLADQYPLTSSSSFQTGINEVIDSTPVIISRIQFYSQTSMKVVGTVMRIDVVKIVI